MTNLYKPINHTSMKYYKLLTFTLLFCLSACGGEKKDTQYHTGFRRNRIAG